MRPPGRKPVTGSNEEMKPVLRDEIGANGLFEEDDDGDNDDEDDLEVSEIEEDGVRLLTDFGEAGLRK